MHIHSSIQSSNSARSQSSKNLMGASFLLAGTAIGSGMISLPMVLAKFGLLRSFVIIIAFALLTFMTALIRIDLNASCPKEATLSAAGRRMGLPKIGQLGDQCIILLSLALMAAYTSGEVSILVQLTKFWAAPNAIWLLVGLVSTVVFSLAGRLILKGNHILLLDMLGTFILLVIGLLFTADCTQIPPALSKIPFKGWSTLVPVLFTSFGFQGSLHALANICEHEQKTMLKASAIGVLIPCLTYMLWTGAVLLATYRIDAAFFLRMLHGQVNEVGELVAVLSRAMPFSIVKGAIWFISLTALLTSILGVGFALVELLMKIRMQRGVALAVAIWLPLVVARLVPGAFVRILNFAGAILACLAIIVPCVLHHRLQGFEDFELKMRPMLQSRWINGLVGMVGCVIVGLGIFELMG